MLKKTNKKAFAIALCMTIMVDLYTATPAWAGVTVRKAVGGAVVGALIANTSVADGTVLATDKDVSDAITAAVNSGEIKTALDGKADASALTTLENIVGTADITGVGDGTLTGAIGALSGTIAGKANQSDLDALSDTVAGKADKTAVESLSSTVNGLSDTIAGKANQSDLDALSGTIAGKANQSDLDALSDTVAGKADKTAVETALIGKADRATTLEGYGIEDAYTKEETNNVISEAVSGLNQRLGKISGKLNKVGAGAAALAALHPLEYDPDDKLTFSAGVGKYAGENAAALGAFYRPDEKLMFSLGGTMGNGENMVNLGVSIGLDGAKGSPKLSRKELIQIVGTMHEESKAIKAENDAIKAENEALEERIAKLEAIVAKLAEK